MLDSNESNWYIKVIVGIWCVALGNTPTSVARCRCCGWPPAADVITRNTCSRRLVCCRRSGGGERVKSYAGKLPFLSFPSPFFCQRSTI